jgi:hypothetical protein
MTPSGPQTGGDEALPGELGPSELRHQPTPRQDQNAMGVLEKLLLIAGIEQDP